MEDTTHIDNSHLKNNSDITLDQLNQLKKNLKTLDKQDAFDVPRIKRNIDQLEGFSQKSLKNQLNDDNKKSQAMIS